jgi:hypothetical protein
MSSFIGNKPNQVPTNGDLGRLAFLDYVGVADVGTATPTLASATNISPTTQISFVSGTVQIVNIIPPPTFVNGGQLTLIPTGKFSIASTGNVSISVSAEVFKPIYLTYVVDSINGNEWYPSYSDTINRVVITAPSAGSSATTTLTIATGKTLSVEKSLTFTSTGTIDNKTLTFEKSLTFDGVDGKILTLNSTLTFNTTNSNPATVTFNGSGTVAYAVSPTFTSTTAAAAITATSTFATPLAIATTGNVTVGGDFSATGNVTAYSLSDKRLKENITPINDPINKLNALSGNTFNWNDDFYATQDQALFKKYDVGVIAQEVQSVLPEAVNERDNGMLAVDYSKLIPLLIECIKAQQVEINELKGRE